eukprot:Nitzschia sp. Nitz4//scaffold106_size73319//51333//55917//NITZ4_005742-RA/size73319-augustus-gene-0.6-mRNA-1//1//CDS//3329532538//6560//frame0
MRELRVEDALLYLDQVKVEFGDRPHIYNEFLDIMKTFKTQQIDTPGVINRVSTLFQGNKRLVLGFNTFLPEGYKIELPEDGDGPPIAVFRAPGDTVGQILTGPGAPPAAPTDSQKPAASAVAPGAPAAGFAGAPGQAALRAGTAPERGPAGMAPLATSTFHAAGIHAPQARQLPPAAAVADPAARARLEQAHVPPGAAVPTAFGAKAGIPGGPQKPSPDKKQRPRAGRPNAQAPPAEPEPAAPPQPQGQQQPGMEFDHAIKYVTTIKLRFSSEPEIYKKFLEILHTYQKEQRGIKEVLEEVSALFSEHPDLLKEFTYFLPDAVQAEAKVQLEAAAREAEARKKAKAAAKAQQRPMAAAPFPSRSPSIMQPEPQPSPELEDEPAVPTNPIPFGATMGRSRDREAEISRSAVYGTVSFAPVRPPRKNTPTTAQTVAKYGRPTVLPVVPRQPTAAETAFFEKAKAHLSRRELAPDKPMSGPKARHTPYMEFLKCLHLFGTGVLNKDELVLLLRGLFVQGHAPKSGANVGGGASNPQIAMNAQELLKECEEILVGRGPYADQQNQLKDKTKFGAKRSRDYDYSGSEHPTPSYFSLPSDYPQELFMKYTGKTLRDQQVLNDTMICVGANNMPGTESPEDYDAIKIRRNAYEEAMFRIEDERFEVDMALERNAVAMRQIEPIAEEIAILRETEEKEGQPIGRLQYKLKPRSLNSIQINAIGRIYGDKGDEIIENIARNPLATIPIVYQRLRQKDVEWRTQKNNLIAKWDILTKANYEGCLDVLCYQNRREIEKSLSDDRLLEECKKARSFCSSLEKRSGSSVSFGLSSPDRSAVLYEPYASVEMKPGSIAHQFAASLLSQHVVLKSATTKAEREKVGRVWSEFVMPFFGYPSHWILDEIRQSFQGELNETVVQYATGQHVRTAVGDGVVLAYLPGNENVGPRYRVKLAYGVGYVQAYAILHGIENPDGTKFVRRDGVMEKEVDVADMDRSDVALDNKFKLLFGSKNIYLFLRLYSSLVSLLEDIEGTIRSNPPSVDPSANYYDPMKSQEAPPATRLDFSALMTNLKRAIKDQMDMKEFETFCRRVSPTLVHKMSALPKLVAKGADMLVQTANEDLLLQLFDYCQYTGANPVQLREKCLALSPDAVFRIQHTMPSLIWGSIFLLLLVELIITLILVLPVPRKTRNWIARHIFQWNLGDRLSKPILYIGIFLVLALSESYITHRRIQHRMEEEMMSGHNPHEYVFHPLDKERRYKSERNMYLAGFSLTLLFVIGRITKLMQESIELEEETERVEKFGKDAKAAEAKQAARKAD